MPGRNSYYKRKLYFSTQDRILLHLLDYVGNEGEFNQPDGMTQFGIADAIALGRSTVSKAIRRLARERIVKSARAHVPSGTLRRTTYFLTDPGVALANRRKIEIEEDLVLFRDNGTERRLRMSQLPALLPEYATLLDVACHVSEGVFDVATFHGRRRQKFVDLTDPLPRLRYFFGRDRELAAMDEWAASPDTRVLVITGITGIGKTTLLSRKLDDWRDQRNVLFHRIMEWTTLRNVVAQLGEFLTRVSRKQLAQYLESEAAIDLEQVVSILRSDLRGLSGLLVYDDYHNAEGGIRNFFYAVRAALETIPEVKLVVAGRSVPPFYDRRDVKVKGTVRELPLEGLDPASGEKILQVRNLALPPDAVVALLRRTAGHPLFLELVDPQAAEAADIHKYLEEELFSRITDVEAKVLTVASVFRYPTPADALFVDDSVDAATLRGLLDQSLLREVSARVYEVHDVVRTFFVSMMTPQERRRYHRWAAHFIVSHPEPDYLEAIHHFSQAEEIASAARLTVKEGRAILRSGRSQELLHLLEGLLPSVEDPAHAAELRLLKAHVLNVRGEVDDAVLLYREILRLPDELALQPKVAEAHRYLGDILRRSGETTEAQEHLDIALRSFRALDLRGGQAEVLLSTGTLAEDLADLPRAERMYERATALAHTAGLPELEVECHIAFARLQAARGDLTEALDRKTRALE
ncbi:MAG TPA: tetratricopeptide repeat protein, partial [Thermoplasmata archaeon]|nr:tetratricopeptide repeat protein [Thermoplasmata archaeon]